MGPVRFREFFRDKEIPTCYVPCRFYRFSLGLGQRDFYYSWLLYFLNNY